MGDEWVPRKRPERFWLWTTVRRRGAIDSISEMGDNFQVDYMTNSLVDDRGVNGCKSNNVAEMRKARGSLCRLFLFFFYAFFLLPQKPWKHQSLCKEQGTHTPGDGGGEARGAGWAGCFLLWVAFKSVSGLRVEGPQGA